VKNKFIKFEIGLSVGNFIKITLTSFKTSVLIYILTYY